MITLKIIAGALAVTTLWVAYELRHAPLGYEDNPKENRKIWGYGKWRQAIDRTGRRKEDLP